MVLVAFWPMRWDWDIVCVESIGDYDTIHIIKTIQVIALIAHLRTRNVSGPFIVVAPLATLPNWIREFEKWLPSVP
eukprot:scaffold37449_cov73-Skeletonema_marinoi.AAC.1